MNNHRIVRTSAGSLGIAAAVAMVCIGIAIGQQQPTQIPPLQKNRTVYLHTPASPDTIPVAQPDWDYFAWNSFVAMNWPALEVVPNHYRGVPNTKKQFATAANSDLAVWETFKEKREVFNHPKTAGQLIWYSPVDYGTLRQGGVSIAPGSRVFHQGAGASQPPDGLDETIEVQSQALEPTLPDGKPNPVFTAVPPVVTPRVWRGQPSAKNPIVYEVKVNYDYFNYVVSNGLNVDNTNQQSGPIAIAAMAAKIHLPYRTSSHMAGGGDNTPVLDYRAATATAAFQIINNIYNGAPPPVPPPPGQGSIQIKAAWLKLGGSGAKPEDFPTWHTAVAQNYITGPDGKPVPSEPTLFGLVGLHIIQRIHTTDPNNPLDANGPGGTFIYATWEHESIFNSPVVGKANQPKPTYFYSNFFAGAVLGHTPRGFYPPLDQPAYPVERLYPVLDNTKLVTATFHNAIRAINPKSVWLHYHLVGTQFQAVDLRAPLLPLQPRFPISPNDPTGIGQPVFMANLAVETNLGLRFFKGQPPTITVIKNYQPELTSNHALGFARHNANTAFSQGGFNMGGCMGCHGVAQSKGYGFSFVLLDGYLGAVTDTQEHFDQPGANPH
jgi:hypothetical protein